MDNEKRKQELYVLIEAAEFLNDVEKQIEYTKELIELNAKQRLEKEDSTPEMKLADKLLNRETVTKGDIQSLNMFGDNYIDMLLETPQWHVRAKLADVLVYVMK